MGRRGLRIAVEVLERDSPWRAVRVECLKLTPKHSANRLNDAGTAVSAESMD